MDWAMKTKGYNQRRACALAGIEPRVYRRKTKRPQDTELRARMKELASERRRFGYRRLHILLRREGWELNWKKLYRVYREEGLTVRKRGGRKRAVGTRTPMAIPQGPNQRWSLDFMSDALEDGRRFRVLNVIDDFTRECLAAVVDTSIGGARVARELDRIAELRGYPCMVVSDNGTELTSNAMLTRIPESALATSAITSFSLIQKHVPSSGNEPPISPRFFTIAYRNLREFIQ
ncbi:IS2 transposase TnpB [Roseovarius sp. THAF8]|nr:IS2 transposase TnpB [Roseovarius sp. THAF8]